jgi:hypothetical protein
MFFCPVVVLAQKEIKNGFTFALMGPSCLMKTIQRDKSDRCSFTNVSKVLAYMTNGIDGI